MAVYGSGSFVVWRSINEVGASVTAGSFIVGTTYTIASVGTTNFTLIGAASNAVGVSFVATGMGAGTGTAVPTIYASGIGTNGIATGMQYLRPKASKVELKKEIYTSDEVRSDRGISDVRHGLRKVEGSLEGELIFSDWDALHTNFMLNALQQGGGVSNICWNGVTIFSLTLEQGFTDINQFFQYTGVAINKWKLTVKPNSLAEMTYDLIGQNMLESTATVATTSTVAHSANSPMSYANGVIMEGGTTIAYVTGVDLDISNGLMQPAVVGANVSPAILSGRFEVKGTVTALFKDYTLLTKFVNETISQLQFSLQDPAGNQMTFYCPEIKYTGGNVAPPKDGAVILSLPFQALQYPGAPAAALVNVSIAAGAAGASVVLTRNGGSFLTDLLIPNSSGEYAQFITISGFVNGVNNGTFAIVPGTVAASTVTLAGVPGVAHLVETSVAGATFVTPAMTLGFTKY